MSREPIESYFFVVVVVRCLERFLLIHERKHGQLWYLPAGRAERGETMVAAALRETREESGLNVKLDGIIRFEHSPHPGYTRCRVVFSAHVPVPAPKLGPTEDAQGGAWVTLAELDDYPLRGQEVRHYFAYVAGGGAIYPLTLLAREGAPLEL